MPTLARFALTFILGILFTSAWTADGEKYALLIGVGDYRPDSGLRKLKYAESDMTALAKAFTDAGFDPTHVFLMTQTSPGDDSVRPRRENIERQIELILNNKEKNDTVVVVFSGHGLQFRGERENYFCPSDAHKNRNTGAIDKSTLVNVSKVYEHLEKCGAGNKLLISDCCRNDPLDERTRASNGESVKAGQLKLPPPIATKPQSSTRPIPIPLPESVAALFSCAEGEFAFEEDKEFQGGVFTHYLIEGLKGKAAIDGQVDVESLAAFLRRRVYDHVSRVFLTVQTPEIKLKGNKAFVLAKVLPPASHPPEVVPNSNAVIANEQNDEGPSLDLGGGVKLELVKIPAGTFEMGSPGTEKERAKDETQHTVQISKPFYMGKFTVTQEQYETIMGENPSYFKGAKNPVESVSWEDAVKFCEKLSQKTGRTIQLPTEAQWEYACRAGTKTPFYFGETISTEQANYNGSYTYGNGVKGEYRQRTTPVGSFKPNAFGLYDMHGNVYQWCQDWYDEDYYNSSPRVNPVNNSQGEMKARVLRGASWGNAPWNCRSAYRICFTPGVRNINVGFRVVVPLASRRPEADTNTNAVTADAQNDKELSIDLGGGVKLELVKIPAGTFEMGSPKTEQGREAQEKQHTVELSKPFYMGKFTVTQEQYDAIMGENESHFKGVKNPVERVSWEDAVKFCEKLSLKTGKTIQLPTEAQWEYACRAGTKTPFYFGETISPDNARYDGSRPYGDGAGTMPVGSFQPNAFGLYDMHGNVYQWCQDWYDKDYYNNSPQVNPVNTSHGEMKHRVLRGGSWATIPRGCRSADRWHETPGIRGDFAGFRVVVPLDDDKELSLDLGNGVKLEIVKIPAGTFQMGSPEKEEKRDEDEKLHSVTISKEFYMGKFHVTVGQFREFVRATGYKTNAETGVADYNDGKKGGYVYNAKDDKHEYSETGNWMNPGFTQGEDEPVLLVSWKDAQKFIEWLSGKNGGKKLRLPTEAEWEYACRAGSLTPFTTGATIGTDEANYNGNYTYGNGVKGEYRKKTTRVGVFKPNAFGLFDMQGNACQWCQDLYTTHYENLARTDPVNQNEGTARALRGGSWYYPPRLCRSARRNYDPGMPSHIIGFRVCMPKD